MNKRFITTFAAILIGFSSLLSANNTLILDTLYEQGIKFISTDSLSGRSASAFSVYKLMARTDSEHPKTHSFALLLDNATKQQVMALVQQGESLDADRLKLEYLSLQYEVGVEPSSWAALRQSFTQSPATTKQVTKTPVPKISPADLKATNQLSSSQVRTLVSNTKVYLRQKQFFAPEHKNAFNNIKRLLKDNPKNIKAIALYFNLLEEVQEEVDDLLEDGEIFKAISLTEQGLSELPDHALLLNLNERAIGLQNIDSHITALHDPNEYIPELSTSIRNALLSNGKTYLKRKQFFAPESSNAYSKYKRVLTSEPDNSKAKSGMFKLVKELDEEVKELISDGKIELAKNLLQQALSAIPEMASWSSTLVKLDDLSALKQKRLDYAQATFSPTMSSRNRKILLSNAKSYIRSGNFFGVDNSNKNANDALFKVLAAEPDNEKVAGYFDDLIEKVNETAIELAEDGELNRAASLINQALTFHSGHPALVTSSGNLNSLIAVIQ